MSPRIYSHNEMREIVLAERKVLAIAKNKLLSQRSQATQPFVSRRNFLKGGLAASMIAAAWSHRSQALAASFAGEMGYISVRDPTFGAVGNGVTDDTAHLQAAINYAYGPPASPHGTSGQYSNLAVFLPAGHYLTTSPLYLVDIAGGKIFGSAPEMVTVSFANPNTGNTIIANGICPVFMTNGVYQFTWEGMTIGSGSHTNAVAVYVFQNGTTSALTTSPIFKNLIINNCDDGILAGYQSSANCENGQLFNVTFNNCPLSGLRVFGQNTLNWQVYGGAANACSFSSTWAGGGSPGNSGAAYSCVNGGMSPIIGTSCSGNLIDVVNVGFGGTTIIGGSSESDKCLGFIGTHAIVKDLAWRPTASLGTVFADVSNGAWLNMSGGFLNPGGNTGAGTLVALGNAGTAILDTVEVPSGGAACVITGTAGSKLYLRGSTFSNANVITGFTGTVGQNI